MLECIPVSVNYLECRSTNIGQSSGVSTGWLTTRYVDDVTNRVDLGVCAGAIAVGDYVAALESEVVDSGI